MIVYEDKVATKREEKKKNDKDKRKYNTLDTKIQNYFQQISKKINL